MARLGCARAGQRDRGSMLVLMVLVGVGLCAAATSALTPLLTDLVDRQRAHNAADAAALAGLVEGRQQAESVAAANSARLVSWSESGQSVTVTVQVGDQSATARATDAP
jgi:hypothetical protein